VIWGEPLNKATICLHCFPSHRVSLYLDANEFLNDSKAAQVFRFDYLATRAKPNLALYPVSICDNNRRRLFRTLTRAWKAVLMGKLFPNPCYLSLRAHSSHRMSVGHEPPLTYVPGSHIVINNARCSLSQPFFSMGAFEKALTNYSIA
jgi:hypothetical protein